LYILTLLFSVFSSPSFLHSEGLGAQEVASHVRFLCGVLGSSLAASNNSSGDVASAGHSTGKREREEDAMDQEEDEECPSDDHTASASGAIEALSSLLRNTRIANRAYVCAATVGVFVRLSCFGQGYTQRMQTETKSTKKKGKKEKEEESAVLSGLNKDIVDAIKLVEGSGDSSSSSGCGSFHVSSEIAELAGVKLMAILADIGNQSLALLDVPAPVGADGKKRGDREKEPVTEGPHSTLLLDVAVATLEHLSTVGGLTLLREAEEESDDEGEGSAALAAFGSVVASMKSLCPSSAPSLTLLDAPLSHSVALKKPKVALEITSGASDATTDSDNSHSSEGGGGKQRLKDSLYGLLGHSIFHTLTSSAVSMQALHDLAEVSLRLISDLDIDIDAEGVEASKAHDRASKDKKTSDDSDDEDDDDEDERPQSILFDASMELLSVAGDHAVKGVRDAIKRAWNALCQVHSLGCRVLSVHCILHVQGSRSIWGLSLPILNAIRFG
jgi:hypothetical protein